MRLLANLAFNTILFSVLVFFAEIYKHEVMPLHTWVGFVAVINILSVIQTNQEEQEEKK